MSFVASICWPPRNIKNVDVEEVDGNMVVEICILTLPVGEICIFSRPFFQLLLRRLGFQFFVEDKFILLFHFLCYLLRLFVVSFCCDNLVCLVLSSIV